MDQIMKGLLPDGTNQLMSYHGKDNTGLADIMSSN